MRCIVTGRRLAVRVDSDTLLAVPPLHPRTPGPVRVLVFELVLRRQIGLAYDVAAAAADEIEDRTAETARFAALISQTPHRNARGAVAA